jgi:lipopolysaccharide export system permease protein
VERDDGKTTERKTMKKFRFTIIDRYIIGKFLGTFFFTIIIIVVVSTIFDLSEHIDDYFEEQANVHEVIFHYYLNFIPYFTIMFSPLITFIAVIYFTSKMAYATEIIALLSSGMSFGRLLRPFFLAAGFIAIFTFVTTNFILPKANAVRLEFAEKYFQGGPRHYNLRNIHKQVRPGVYIYMESYSTTSTWAISSLWKNLKAKYWFPSSFPIMYAGIQPKINGISAIIMCAIMME